MSVLQLLSCVFVFATAGFLFVNIVCPCLRESTDNCASTDNEVQQTYDITTAPEMLGNIKPNGKYAVFSTTSVLNEDSLGFIFLLPLTVLAWKRIGFDSVVIIVGSVNVWNSDPLLHAVLTSVRQLDATVIFLDVHPTNSVMVSQVRNICVYFFCQSIHICYVTRLLRRNVYNKIDLSIKFLLAGFSCQHTMA